MITRINMWLSKSIGDLVKIVWKFEVHFKQYYKTKYKLMHFQYVKSDVFSWALKCVYMLNLALRLVGSFHARSFFLFLVLINGLIIIFLSNIGHFQGESYKLIFTYFLTLIKITQLSCFKITLFSSFVASYGKLKGDNDQFILWEGILITTVDTDMIKTN